MKTDASKLNNLLILVIFSQICIISGCGIQMKRPYVVQSTDVYKTIAGDDQLTFIIQLYETEINSCETVRSTIKA